MFVILLTKSPQKTDKYDVNVAKLIKIGRNDWPLVKHGSSGFFKCYDQSCLHMALCLVISTHFAWSVSEANCTIAAITSSSSESDNEF